MDDSDSATIPRPAKVSIQREVMARRVRAAAREPVWAVSRALLSPTAPFRTLPDYLLIGCQRCGTTSLQAALSQHPSVKSARLMKGVHYFDTAYDRDLNWYRSYFPTNAYRRRHDTRAGRRLVVGECSPYYIFHPLALERIANDLPDIKVVVLFRDPVERAIFHHKHEVRRGNETLGLREALDAEPLGSPAKSTRSWRRRRITTATRIRRIRMSREATTRSSSETCSATFRPTGSWSFPAKASSPHPRQRMSEC